MSVAAPTIEGTSNIDNISEDRSLYKSGREKVTTLGIGDRPPNNFIHSRLQQVDEAQDKANTDFAITVVSTKHQAVKSRSKSKTKVPVPFLRGLTDVSEHVAANEIKNTPPPAFQYQPSITTQHIVEPERLPASMRTANVDGDADQKLAPDDQERLMPAPMITGREALVESSKDECQSQPSRHFASIDGAYEHTDASKRATLDKIDSDRKDLINCLKNETSAEGVS